MTVAARTLRDLAMQARTRTRTLERAVAEALALRLTDLAGIRAAARRSPRRAARRLLELVDGGPPPRTRSEAEERFLGLVRRAGIAAPEVNVVVARHEVDFFWAGEGLVVEVDGFAFHASPVAFERDRRRDADLAAAGLRVVRVTWRQITGEPEAVVARVGAALAAGTSP